MDASSGTVLAFKGDHKVIYIPKGRKICYMKKLEGLGPFGGNFLEEAINREKGILEF